MGSYTKREYVGGGRRGPRAESVRNDPYPGTPTVHNRRFGRQLGAIRRTAAGGANAGSAGSYGDGKRVDGHAAEARETAFSPPL